MTKDETGFDVIEAKKEDGGMKKDRINMKHVQWIYENCLDIIEKHEDVAGQSVRAEEALAIFQDAVRLHFNIGYGSKHATQMAYSKVFKSTIETGPIRL